MTSTFLASLLSAAFVLVGVQVVVMDVLWGVLTLSCVGDSIEASVWEEVPTSLRLVGQENVGAVVPSEPSGHLLG